MSTKQLFAAARRGKVETIRSLVAEGVDVNSAIQGATALHEAAEAQREESVAVLLELHANPLVQDEHEWDALMKSTLKERGKESGEQVAHHLLATPEGARVVVQTNRQGMTALMLAARKNETTLCSAIVEANTAALEIKDHKGKTALTWSSLFGQREAMEKLIELDAKVDAADEGGMTPLLWVCVCADVGGKKGAPILKTLLSHGANVNVVNADGRTGLMLAAHKGHKDLVDVLVSHHAGLDVQDQNGWTALMFASLQGTLGCVSALVQAGADVTLKDNDGNDAKYFAAGNEEVVRLLSSK